MEFQRKTLDNGLEIVAEIDPEAYSAAIGFFVRTGARDENDSIAGVSHFLEHMVFKGTPRRSAADVNRELDEMGGASNAYTSEEMTVFYAAVLPELLPRAVDLLADILRPSLREEDFRTEKKVILEEIKMYEDQPPFGIDEKCREIFFAGHPLSRSVLGTLDSVGKLTSRQMRDYFDARYSPDNITVVVCGKVDFDRLVQDVDRACGGWKPVPTTRETFRPIGKTGSRLFVRPNSAQEYIFLLSDAPSVRDEDRYAAAILANIIGDDVGSRLFWELVDNGRSDCASLSFGDFYDAGFFYTSLCCAPEDASSNLRILEDLYREILSDGVREEELERSKNKLLSRLVLSEERTQGRLFSVGTEWTQTRKYYPIQKDMEIVRKMTLDQINAIIKKYPLLPSLTIAVGPCENLF